MASTWCLRRFAVHCANWAKFLRLNRYKHSPITKSSLRKITVSLGFVVIASELKKGDESLPQLKIPDPSTLTTEYLLRNAASMTLDSACALLSQTTVALSDASKEYMKHVFVLIKLIEYKIQILGNEEEENKVWDLIMEAKNNINEASRKKMNLVMLHTTVTNILTSTAEAAYLAGAEHSSNIGSERLNCAERYLREVNLAVDQVEVLLREAEVKTIEAEAKHAEEEEKREKKKLEEERSNNSDDSDKKDDKNDGES